MTWSVASSWNGEVVAIGARFNNGGVQVTPDTFASAPTPAEGDEFGCRPMTAFLPWVTKVANSANGVNSGRVYALEWISKTW